MKKSWLETLWNEEIRRRCGRHCREGEGSKVEMIWTCNKRRWRESWSETLWNEEIRRRCGAVDIAEKVREARLR
jgi:hypothetical protein